ncbi:MULTISPECIES: hypothetical protein [unclassified Microbacterium]|uniref:hypothetical protein n=1 Tax=unclassified Microbacterium TaxID=2609290 RepID=UPI00197B7F42|nr:MULTISPECIES: hypothetical protein [unclassified Microbacterium]
MTSFARGAARTSRLVRDVVLAMAAIGGAACIVFAVLAFTGGYSLMMFKTGSMSPTIPAGSVALVQRVPASDIVVGDVVTVDRAGTLPITHRVTSVRDGAGPAERVLTMRGDANPVDDPTSYTITEARIVRGSVPNLAPVIAQFGNPWVLGSLTLGTAFLVAWAFWPRRETTRPDDDDAPPGPMPPPEETATQVSAGRGALATVLIVTASAMGATLTPSSADAATTSDYLVVRSDLAGAGVQGLDPLDPLLWHLDVDASAAPPDGELALALSSTGDARFGLRAEVRACAEPWLSDGTCASGERVLRPEGPLLPDGLWQPLDTATTPAVVHVQVALTAQPETPEAAAAGASVTVRATAAGDTVDTGIDGESELPPTGGSGFVMLAAPAAVLVGIGIALLARRRTVPGRTE